MGGTSTGMAQVSASLRDCITATTIIMMKMMTISIAIMKMSILPYAIDIRIC